MERDGMQFMTALFGGSDNTLLNSAFALGIVLVLIVLGLWVLKLFTRGATGIARGKRRLAVIDTAVVDGKRQVILIRRDNVEHVIMTGGPQDLIIETGIPAPDPVAAPMSRRPMRPPVQPAAAVHPTPAADIATPVMADRPVSREAVDRLGDLARPAPLQPVTPLRRTALLRPVARPDAVIPMGPELRIDNSAGGSADSAKPGLDGTNGRLGLGGRNRFFRSVTRTDGN